MTDRVTTTYEDLSLALLAAIDGSPGLDLQGGIDIGYEGPTPFFGDPDVERRRLDLGLCFGGDRGAVRRQVSDVRALVSALPGVCVLESTRYSDDGHVTIGVHFHVKVERDVG